MATETSGRPERIASGRARLVWRLTAGSGVALLVLLTAHMVANHFVVEGVGGLRSYDQVLDYIADPWMLSIEIAFLGVVTLHAMLGLRSVLFDLTASSSRSGSSRSATASSWS